MMSKMYCICIRTQCSKLDGEVLQMIRNFVVAEKNYIVRLVSNMKQNIMNYIYMPMRYAEQMKRVLYLIMVHQTLNRIFRLNVRVKCL